MRFTSLERLPSNQAMARLSSSLLIPGMIVLTTAILTLVSAVILGQRLAVLMPADALFLFTVIHGFSSIGSAVGLLITWPLLSFATHSILTYVMGKYLPMRSVLHLLGWCHGFFLTYSISLTGIAFFWPLRAAPVNTLEELLLLLRDSRVVHITNQIALVFLVCYVIAAISIIRSRFSVTLVQAGTSVVIPVLILIGAHVALR